MSEQQPNFFQRMKTAAQIVAVNTEISVLWDQITSLKREYGLRTFDLMADPEANKEALVEVFQELNAKIAPKVQKWNEKHARKQVLTGEPAPIPVAEVSANQENETNANDADAPPEGWSWDHTGAKR